MRAMQWCIRSVLTIGALVFSAAAFSQDFPSRTIKLVVPYAPSGLPDVLARLVGQAMSTDIGHPVVVENKPGGTTIIGAESVAKAASDGYTLLVADNNSFGIVPAVVAKLPYDIRRDFAPVTQAVRSLFFLFVNPSIGVNSVQDLVSLAKARPGALNYGSPGNATGHHLAMEQFKLVASVDLTHVPYKGVVQAAPALLSGEVAVMFNTLPSMINHVKVGKLKVIGLGATQRTSLMPEIPTIAESGYPGFDISSQVGFAAPGATPRPIVERLNIVLVRAMKVPDVSAKLAALGLEVVAGTPEQYAEVIGRERAHYARLVGEIKLKVE
jgi:tripartite-type tricarboxylate transporter receptor subunit TctC